MTFEVKHTCVDCGRVWSAVYTGPGATVTGSASGWSWPTGPQQEACDHPDVELGLSFGDSIMLNEAIRIQKTKLESYS